MPVVGISRVRLTEDDKKAISEAVSRAEARTSGEIVFAITEASGRYRYSHLQLALTGMAVITALYLVIPGQHSIGAVLWTEILSFACLYALASRVPWRRWFIPSRELEARVREAAFTEFYSSGLYRTRDSNGVLIYLSILERHVVVLGDRGVHEKMGDEHWTAVRDLIIRGIRNGQARSGICSAIEKCGNALAEHFPLKPDDTNELPNAVIDRTRPPDPS
jgi:putative membrane protein